MLNEKEIKHIKELQKNKGIQEMIFKKNILNYLSCIDKSLTNMIKNENKNTFFIKNISGRRAYVILSSYPIMHITKIKNNNGYLDFSLDNKHEIKKKFILNNTICEIELYNSKDIYYSVLFEENGKWKLHFKDRKLIETNSINLLEKHLEDSINLELIPCEPIFLY
jgi:hypothetical protein